MKIHKPTCILLFTVLLCCFQQASAQKAFIDENINYWYNTGSDLHINHNVFADVDTLYVFAEISFKEDLIYDDFDFIKELRASYHTADLLSSDTIDIKNSIVYIKSGKIIVFLKMPKIDKADLMVIRAVNKESGRNFLYDIPLIKDYNYSTDGLVFVDEKNAPYLSAYANIGQTMQLTSINAYDELIYGYYYKRPFDTAVPPMVIEQRPVSKGLQIDSSFTIQPNTPVTFDKAGMYFFQKDSSTAKGISIRVEDQYYPIARSFNSVLDPLIYISTRAETEAIRNSVSPQKAFEKYWLDLIKIPEKASETIRKYYEGVSGANFLFTNFKEGWKSDMGMIYIIYGPPNDVYKSEEIMDWVYNRDLSMPTVRFSFYKVKNLFADQHYSLLRKKNYDKNWFKSVEMWRDGNK